MLIRCDKSMKRSKMKCRTEAYTRWRCTKDCMRCICGMRKLSDGCWEHIKLNAKGEMARTHGKGEVYD